jgi:serine protease Do
MNLRNKSFLGAGLAIALTAGSFAAGRLTQAPLARAGLPVLSGQPATPPLRQTLPSFADLAAQVSPAVVNVKVTAVEQAEFPGQSFDQQSPFPGFPFPMPQPREGFKRQGTGSGFIIRKDGMILTNNHVIESAREITVTLSDKREFSGKVVGRDPKTDLAVIKIDVKTDAPAATFGNSDALRVGDWVMAIGNPFGLSNTVTAGIVSAKGRIIGAGPYDDFIQTDAPINPGNSGGPLFNTAGEVVGINSVIFSRAGGNIGIGFAIPINLAKALVPELEAKGTVTRGWLGVSVQPLNPGLARSLGVDKAQGALVAEVTPHGPAANAGIQRGDVILTYDGKKIDEPSALPMLVASTAVGKNVPLEVAREGKTTTINVTVGKLPDENVALDTKEQKPRLGLVLRELRPDERTRLGLRGKEGVLVENVAQNSPADNAGIEPGDVLLQVNQTPVDSVKEARSQLGKTTQDKPLLLLLRRHDGRSEFLALYS